MRRFAATLATLALVLLFATGAARALNMRRPHCTDSPCGATWPTRTPTPTSIAFPSRSPSVDLPGGGAGSDFNGDGFADLAAGVPRENVDGVRDAGGVNVLYGSSSGLQGAGSQLWHEGSTGVPGEPSASDLFGFSLAVGDLDGDGYADLAIGSPFEDAGPATNAGALVVLYGSPLGLGADQAQRFDQDTVDVPDVVEEGDQFAYALAVGDLDTDGFSELVIGVQREDLPNSDGIERGNAGAVQVLRGSAAGVTAVGSTLVSQSTDGVPGEAERGDEMGSTIASADLNGDGSEDIVAGAPYEEVDGASSAGAAYVIPGSAAGIQPTMATVWDQTTAGIADKPEVGDLFSWALTTGDLNGDGNDDLVIGAHGELISGHPRAGAVHVLPGGPDGPTVSDATFWHQGSVDVPGTVGTEDAFGKAVAAGDLNGDGNDDLAIGARYDDEAGVPGAGAVNVLYGGVAGVSSAGAQLWTQTSTDSGETSEEKDHFGSILAIAPLQGATQDSLAIGAHFESWGGSRHQGALHVLAGGTEGITSSDSQLWTQDSPGVRERSDSNDFFPFALAAD